MLSLLRCKDSESIGEVIATSYSVSCSRVERRLILVIPQPLINSPWLALFIALTPAATHFAGENMNSLVANDYLCGSGSRCGREDLCAFAPSLSL